MTQARGTHSCVLLNGVLYAAGGWALSSALVGLPSCFSCLLVVIAAGGRSPCLMFCVSCQAEVTCLLLQDQFEQYDERADKWAPLPPMQETRLASLSLGTFVAVKCLCCHSCSYRGLASCRCA